MAAPDARHLARVVIQAVSPQLDGGRYPVKRVVGDALRVEADVFKDGHDLLGARVCFRAPGEREWSRAPLEYHYDADRWIGSVPLDRIGRWRFTVEAWPDRFRTWREDLRKWVDAGEDVSSELLEGARLLRTAARKRRSQPQARGAGAQRASEVGGRAASERSPEERNRLAAAAALLEDPSLPLEQRLAAAFDDALAARLAGPLEPADLTRYERELEVVVDRERASFGSWYELFPRSQSTAPGRHGSFADAERRLVEIAELGFDVVYLPPIHPIGRTHRKGRNNAPRAAPGDPGSPWAIGAEEGGHTAVHPELGTLDDFERFVRTAKSLGVDVALDYALQCSPDHPWVREHPQWFRHRPDGTIRYAENPPKKYQDIYPLDFWSEDREGLWNACRDLLLFWIERGVRVFRVDNPHTKPFGFWEWVIEEVQRQHPDVIFLAEAFTRPNKMYALAKLGFTQSYTYFTWKNTWWELRDYLTELTQTEVAEHYRPNFFANTPDILHEYLQKGGRPAFLVRLVLAATLSPTYGIYSGYELCENQPLREGSEEYLHSEKYEIRVRDWNAPGNLNEEIRRINRIRRENPALQRLANLQFLHSDNQEILWYRKSAPGNELLVAVNLDPGSAQATTLEVPLAALGATPEQPVEFDELLSGERWVWRGARQPLRLDPSERVACVLRRRSAR